MPWTMSFGYMMIKTSHGSNGDSKEEEPEKAKEKEGEKEKVKEDQAADFSDLVEKEKERDEVKAILLMSNRQHIQKSTLKRILMRILGSQPKEHMMPFLPRI